MTSIETKRAKVEAEMAILLKALKALLVMAEERYYWHPDIVAARNLIAKIEGTTPHVVPREPAKP